jgi:hypothetical protein
MNISRNTLRGYILEEVLAYLIRNTGYRLLVDAAQDEQELGWRHNGLVVKGRGAVHQVDVLGELSWIPAFTYPLRLFVEAKFRRTRTGIAEVRNMVATLLDVNQNNLPQMVREAGSTPQLRRKYYYAGSIFSASGFSAPAMDMALAHNVSLIGLDTPEFKPLLDAITTTADLLRTTLRLGAIDENQDGHPNEEDETGNIPPEFEGSRGRFLLALRTTLRNRLETQTAGTRGDISGLLEQISPLINDAVEAAVTTGELFVGMGRGPYMLVLKADQPELFLHYARAHPTHDVMISWSSEYDDGGTWEITPVNVPPQFRAYRLAFRIPKPVYDWIFSAENIIRAALNAKKRYFSGICIYHKDAGRDLLIRLEFNPNEIRRRE